MMNGALLPTEQLIMPPDASELLISTQLHTPT